MIITAEQSDSDMELLTRFIAGDSVSFTVLFARYLPLVHKFGRHYYFQDVDQQDWEQEARIVMLKTIRCYKTDLHVDFGYFFKVNLKHRAFDIIRKENAFKRVHVTKRINLEEDDFGNLLVDYHHSAPDDCTMCHENMKEFLAQCSPFEIKVFSLLHSGSSQEMIAKTLNCNARKVTSALDRCQKKMNVILK
ncbi:RNA polymerase sigma factor [Paucilactobacillus wasatchensis]|uniref:RNA polymerase sigma factor SigS n=1 Tax=Paucilactobacillus wasatchensis TaxID=1335616 RepID=A0A0D0Y6A4_9LACO|nr:sigma-70 family RNA polymerase sigma factor [Paucilactobacillus wasatchensis]KIS03803.1 RNA polymerase, sigma-24 subunit [Paucilactobacillus wasatchensis]